MRTLLRRINAFVVRDFRAETSYRLAFVLQLTGLAWSIALFWFVARLVPEGHPSLARYGGDWFSFVLLGYAPLEYLRVAVIGFSSRIREAQAYGTLEALLVGRAGLPTILFGSVAYPYIWATLRAALFFAIGVTSASSFGNVNFPAFLLFMGLALLTFGAIGVLSASFIMVFKKGDPISWLFLGTSTLFSGLFFPTELLGQFRVVSWALPLTYAMEGTRLAGLGSTVADLRTELLALVLFAVVLVPLAAWTFRVAVARARRDGTLSHY